MRKFHTALGLTSFLAIAGAALMVPTVSRADVEGSYVACNQAGDCWRVHKLYAYGADVPITYYNSDWYTTHQTDAHIHWRADPDDDRGYYVEGRWHPDPGARAVAGGATGAALGAAIGCVVTLPIGCRDWRGHWWRSRCCRRRSLDASLIQPRADCNSIREKVRIFPGLLSACLKSGECATDRVA